MRARRAIYFMVFWVLITAFRADGLQGGGRRKELGYRKRGQQSGFLVFLAGEKNGDRVDDNIRLWRLVHGVCVAFCVFVRH